LDWVTASELNSDRFEIERSVDAESWVTLGSVRGQGTKSTRTNYTYIDVEPPMATIYYRLKQVDFDGKFTYSPIRSVEFEWIPGLSVYPNPVIDDNPTVKIVLPTDENIAALRITSTAGIELGNYAVDLGTSRAMTQHLNVKDYPSGVYVVTLQTANKIFTVRLVVTH
jgi:hypothetical protein